jgi:tripartite-type tricarboxylate transporter receptor subunit TctC
MINLNALGAAEKVFDNATKLTLRVFVAAFLLLASSASSFANVALVFGNAKYLHTTELRNPPNDAEIVSQAISGRGFAVSKLIDVSAAQMQLALDQFFERLSRTKRGFLFFAGHGLQISGKNYLLPVDFSGSDRKDVETRAISLQSILNRAAQISPDALVIVLDACRDDPFTNGSANSQIAKGLGEAGQIIPPGVTVVYGASAGQTALDDLGATDTSKNGVFTRFFAKNLQRIDLTLPQIIRLTRDEVLQSAATVVTSNGKSHKQIPSLYDASKAEHPLFSTRVNKPVVSALNNLTLDIVLPIAARSATDFSLRIIASALQSRGVQVSLVNIVDIPGTQVANLPYPHDSQKVTLLASPFLASLNRHMLVDDRLKPLTLLTETPMMLGASKSSGINNMQSLARVIEQRVVKIAISGRSAPSAACTQILQNQFGSDKFNVQEYRGVAPALAELLGGNVDLFCADRASLQPQVDAGRLAYVANLQEEAAPDARPATAQSQGYALVVPNWFGVFVARDLPQEQVAQLVALFRDVLSDPAVVQRFAQGADRLVPTEKTGPEEVSMSLRLNAAMAR